MFVYENINFERGGDIKRSMGIGKYAKYKKHLDPSSLEEAAKTLIELIPLILGIDEIPENIIAYTGYFLNPEIFAKLEDYVDKYFSEKYRLGWLVEKLEKYLREMGFRYVP